MRAANEAAARKRTRNEIASFSRMTSTMDAGGGGGRA
jgi:hypothetical protein